MSLRRRFLNAVRLIGAENVIVVSGSNGRLPISSFPAAADTNAHESIIFVPTCGRANATSYEPTVFMQLPSKRFLHWRPYSVFLDTNAHVAATSITNMGYGTRENTANKYTLKIRVVNRNEIVLRGKKKTVFRPCNDPTTNHEKQTNKRGRNVYRSDGRSKRAR